MIDLSRLVNIVIAAITVGVMGYLLAAMAFPGTTSPTPRLIGTAVGVVLGILSAVWVNSGSSTKA